MFDCYSILDSQGTPEYPNEDDYIDSFDFEEFKLLSELTAFYEGKSMEFMYFKDFRIMNFQVEEMTGNIKTILSSRGFSEYHKKAYQKMNNILQVCLNKGMGLVCFCD
ncbi:hypothetical protein SAMN04488109_0029 [Chryseolinea serpens]|uniref:Uncharacterized protein n=1 Tax=Chryseolinea serpens TaxID=947013 RepID=A0A1M5JFI1_9BACT|nr:hypothetical protein SAMN04488109_0029 [Chryseolinea serpens]